MSAPPNHTYGDDWVSADKNIMNKKTKFIQCGFEFTVARRADTILPNNLFMEYSDEDGELVLETKKEKIAKEDGELFSRELDRKYFLERIKREYGVEIDLPLPLTHTELLEKERARLAEERNNLVIAGVKDENDNSLSPLRKLDSINVRYKNKNKLSPYKWINKNFSSDCCGAEIATKIIKKHSDITKVYKELMWFVNKYNLTVSLEEATCGLGGCHIHMSLKQFGEIEKHYFIKNIAIFFTNCPELNWGFNDPNDNENANSLLMPIAYMGATFDAGDSGIDYQYQMVENENGIKEEKGKRTYRPGSKLYKFRKENNVFRIMMAYPLETSLHKQYSFRYNKGYNTLEFRIFDMPDTLKRHLLHHEVASAIFNICASYAQKHETMELTLTEFDYNLKRSIERFYACLKQLGINKNRVSDMVENIKTRYKWTEENKESEENVFHGNVDANGHGARTSEFTFEPRFSNVKNKNFLL